MKVRILFFDQSSFLKKVTIKNYIEKYLSQSNKKEILVYFLLQSIFNLDTNN